MEHTNQNLHLQLEKAVLKCIVESIDIETLVQKLDKSIPCGLIEYVTNGGSVIIKGHPLDGEKLPSCLKLTAINGNIEVLEYSDNWINIALFLSTPYIRVILESHYN